MEIVFQKGKPDKDGEYFVIWWGKVSIMSYTVKYGWNTGSSTVNKIPDDRIDAWAKTPNVDEVMNELGGIRNETEMLSERDCSDSDPDGGFYDA